MFDDADCLVEFERLSKRNKIISSKKKRRFSDEQIRCLEVMFESETKLEAGKKAEVARELGLQPRQIAIWFQNRRARWKSKKIESDYSLLLSEYNSLSSQFESLKKDNHSLLSQLQKLKQRSAEVAEAELVKMSDSDELITQPSQSYQWWDLLG